MSFRKKKVVRGTEHFECNECRKFFPRSGFYTNKRMACGIHSACKSCHIQIAMKSRDPENTRKIRRESAARVRLHDPERFRKRERARVRPVDEKVLARRALSVAVRSGKVMRPEACQKCRKVGRITGHHKNYAKALQVQWLCYLCHAGVHRGRKR